MLPYKSVYRKNFDVATELIAHGRQLLLGHCILWPENSDSWRFCEPLLRIQLLQCFGELLAEFRGIWLLICQTTQLVHHRLTLLLGRVSFSRGGQQIPAKCNEPKLGRHACHASVEAFANRRDFRVVGAGES